MQQYKDLCERILIEGIDKDDRTGVGTRSISGAEIRFNMSEGFPIITEKKVPFKLISSELLWFINGDTNIRYLLQNGNHIWDEWPFKRWVESDEYAIEFPEIDMSDFGIRAVEDEDFAKVYKAMKDLFCTRILEDDDFAEKWGDCGRSYSAQWRRAYYVNPETLEVSEYDQLGEIISELKRNPMSRRLVVSCFTPDNQKHAALPCCHYGFQFLVREGKLDLIWSQRSCDYFLGIPFNISSYGILLCIVAKEVGLEPGYLIGHLADVHIYKNHINQVMELLSRESFDLPEIWLNPEISSFEDYTVDDIKLIGYKSHGAIKAPVAV